MSERGNGVGMNGEPDDFAARYDRMVVGTATGWAVRTLVALVVLLVVVGVVSSLVPSL